MNLKDISDFRLRSHCLLAPPTCSAEEIVNWMGAIQAQDFSMSKWAVGVRCQESTQESVSAALDEGRIIRTHLLRPTWHLVSNEDASWMIDLTAPRISSAMRSFDRQLELTDETFSRANSILQKVLRDNQHLTREAIAGHFNAAGIHTDSHRLSHLLVHAEINKIICSGRGSKSTTTYALFCERISARKSLPKELSLAKLAEKYFRSHGPATLQDFYWWSGLALSDARIALESIKLELQSVTIEQETYWFSDKSSLPDNIQKGLLALPAFDEFLISYKDRSASIPKAFQSSAISINGIFKPIIVWDGRVIGIWKREVKGGRLIIHISLFQRSVSLDESDFMIAFVPYGQFTGLPLEVKIEPF